MPLSPKTSIPDAAESNAGDNYHLVYAVRKSLELLNFSTSGLKALSLEGLVRSDEKELDLKSLLAVDLTEYYGGEDLSSASSVVISQLKHSTRHASKSWTAAELCQGKKTGTKGSVMDRLGFLYADLVKTKPADKKKIAVKLVSNRPVSVDLETLITELKTNQGSQKKKIDYNIFLKTRTAVEADILKRLLTATNIPVDGMIDFLLALDFSDCGSGSSIYQRSRSYEALSKLGDLDVKTQFAKLKDLVGDRMLPTSKDNNTLYKSDILFEFGFSDLSDLFPVRNQILLPKNVVKRAQLGEIVNLITDSCTSIVCLHGHAGIGKSTTISAIPENLPAGSKAFTFDCYGGGAYNDSDDRRHYPEYAFLQFCNDLALQIGTPFLLVRNATTGQMVKEFRKRLEQALALLKANDPGALLVFLIDAADNSISAAHHFQSECFVTELSAIGIPEGCKIVFSARTERVGSLKLPSTAKSVDLAPFSADETGEFLKPFYGGLDNKEISDFKELTFGIPRVMAYVLENPGNTLVEKTQFLRPKGKTLDLIFNQRIVLAQKRAGDVNAIDKFLGTLVALPSPVPEIYLNLISGLSDNMLTDLRTDLWHGLVYSEGNYRFRDEDFETYLRTRYKATPGDYATIANILLADSHKNEYASRHLGNFLYHSGSKNELIKIVIEKKFLTIPSDPIKNKEIFIERVRLAMRMTENADLDFFKLQFIAAEAAKSNELIENILRNHADLAAAYGDLKTNQKLYFQSGNPHWFGPAHFRNAAVFSRDPKTHNLALEHLNNTTSWLNYRENLSDDVQRDYEFTAKDVAYGAEALLRIFGPKRCAEYIRSWSPKSFGFEIFEELLKLLIAQESNQQLNKWLKGFVLRADLVIAAVNLFHRYGLKVGFEWHKITKLPNGLSLNFQTKLIGFIEFALANGWDYARVLPLLNLIRISYPTYLPGFYHSGMNDSGEIELDLLFRVKALRKHLSGDSFLVEDFYSESLKLSLKSEDHKVKTKYKEEKEKLDRLYKHLVPVYDCRAAFILKITSEKTFNKNLKAVIDRIKSDWELRHYHQYQYQRISAFMMHKLLDAVFFTRKEEALSIISKGFDPVSANNTSSQISLAARLSMRKDYHEFVLKLLQSSEANMEKELLPGNTVMEYYTDATIIASRISKADGKYYFDKLVIASGEIDEEAYDQIRCISTICDGADFKNPKLAFIFGRYVEYCSVKLGDGEYFPWEETVKALAALDTRSLWPVMCRWDHRNIRKQRNHVIDIARISLEVGQIDYQTAAAILTINPYFVYGAKKMFIPIIAKANEAGDKLFKNRFLRDFLHDLKICGSPKLDFSFTKEIIDSIQDGKYCDKQILKDYQDYLQTVKLLQGGGEKTQAAKVKKGAKKDLPSNAIKKHLKNVVIDKDLNIPSLIAELRSKNADKRGYVPVDEIFTELRLKARAGKEQFYLDALANISEEQISFYDFQNALEATMVGWEHLAVLKQWRQKCFKLILLNWISSLTAYRSLDYSSIKKLQFLFGATEKEVANVVNQYFPDHIDELPAEILYNLFRLSITGVSTDDRKELITWVLERWSEPIRDDFADGQFSDSYIPATSNEELLIPFFQYNLGHPVRALRWRAAHAIRRLVEYGQIWLVDGLIKVSRDSHIGPYQDGNTIFYWMSSRLYFFIALEKVTRDNPAQVKPFAGTILSELLDNGLPHTQIKFFLRSACLFLDKTFPGLYSAEEKNSIHMSLSPVKRVDKARSVGGLGRRRYRGEDGVRFDFDHTDTVPYWYEGLADVLGVETKELILVIDRFIVEDWGFTGDPHKLDRINNDYGQTQNRHGDEPRIENLQRYFEYHGMFCAAFELLKKKGSLKKGGYSTWESWIDGWGLAWPDHWLGDLRDPIPLEPMYWEVKTQDNEWEYSVQPSDFHERVGSILSSKTVTLDENSYLYFGKDNERIKIESGLVNPDTAPALLAALQTSSPYDSYIPHKAAFSDGWDDESLEPDNKFITESLVTVLQNKEGGIDDRDALFNDYSKHRIIPSQMVQNVLHLSLTADQRCSYSKSAPSIPVTHYEVWNNSEDERQYDSSSTSGHRFTIEKTALLDLLCKRNKCLIINCHLSRDLDRAKHDEYLPDNHLTYLIYPNGIAHTITGHHSIR
jgi:hypothetical protein